MWYSYYSEKTTKEYIMSNNVVQGYDGSIHAASSERSSVVKIRGHVKEHEFAKRIGGDVIKGRKKPDVIKDKYRYSVKGADKSIQFMLLTHSKSGDYYGIGHPMYNFVVAGYNHRKFKFDNNNFIDKSLFSKYKESADKVSEWLTEPINLRYVLEKVISDGYDANKLVVLKETNQDAFVYDMKEIIDLYTNSDYKIHVTDTAKVVITTDDYGEIFYLEIRGGKDHCGSLKHGVQAPQFYYFLKENLNCEVISE